MAEVAFKTLSTIKDFLKLDILVINTFLNNFLFDVYTYYFLENNLNHLRNMKMQNKFLAFKMKTKTLHYVRRRQREIRFIITNVCI